MSSEKQKKDKLKYIKKKQHKLDYNDVMDLTSEITYRLQDLKLIKGNNKNYNFEVDDEMRAIICKTLNIREE